MSDFNDQVEISVVVPVYNSAATVPELCQRLGKTLSAMGVTYELVFVDDGSSDGSYAALRAQQEADPHVKVIKMLRNFGQHPAITAGLLHSRGRWVVLTDDDLQTPPEEIAALYAKAREGFDIVTGSRPRRRDNFIRRLGSRLAQWLMRQLFGPQIDDAVSAFRIISRRAVDAYLRLPETHTYVAALLSWLGFPHTSIPVRHEPSKLPRSRYSYRKLFGLWINMAIGFSDRPLKIATWTGVALSLMALVLAVRTVVVWLIIDKPVEGYTSLFVSQMFFFGVTLIFLGILGEYVGHIHREVKRRPFFLIDYEKSVGVTEVPDPAGGPPA
jgi:dolichol-phosphate mannosyltransferase